MVPLRLRSVTLLLLALLLPLPLHAATPPMPLYEQLRALSTSGDTLRVENIVLKRDRLEFTFTGEFQPSVVVEGKVRAASFQGQGRVRTAGWSVFERESIKRYLNADAVDQDFTRALLLFTDDTWDALKAQGTLASAAKPPSPLIAPVEDRMVRETGMNPAAWLALAITVPDHPGIFIAEMEGGRKGRFGAVLDHHGRVTANIFGLNAGEKGLLYQNRGVVDGNDIWTAFFDEADFTRGSVFYSDTFNLVEIPDYRMDFDLRDPGGRIQLEAALDIAALRDGVQLVPLRLNEGLDEYESERLKKGLKVKSAALEDGTPVAYIQHPWERGMWLALPKPLANGEKSTVKLTLEGNDTLWSWEREFHYPRSTTSWFPRHGYLDRARFDVTFRHKPRTRIISTGERVRENVAEDGSKYLVTQWRNTFPVAFTSFAVGPFERHNGEAKVGGRSIPIEYYSLPSSMAPIKEDYVVAELANHVQFYSELFGEYPYPRLGATFFPAGFGQGFPTMLLLPYNFGFGTSRYTQFMAHESAHQWWGNKVAWRSYRDQWLSEGFAEYSALLYTARREKVSAARDLMKEWFNDLEQPPRTDTGVGSGKLADFGPTIMGYRLAGRRSYNAYSTLIYSKGGLIMRMLHFLFSDPATGDDAAFYAMMKDFVKQHEHGWASTESFFDVAGQHFADSPVGRKYGIKDLKWFMNQWVYRTGVPKYRLEYRIQQGASGPELVGMMHQEGVPEGWFMPVPIRFQFGKGQMARGTVAALGPSTPVKIALPSQPTKVELDPERWLLAWSAEAKQAK